MAFAFVADIDNHFFTPRFNHGAVYNFALRESRQTLLKGLFHRQHCCFVLWE